MARQAENDPAPITSGVRETARMITCKECGDERLWKPRHSLQVAPERCMQCSKDHFGPFARRLPKKKGTVGLPVMPTA